MAHGARLITHLFNAMPQLHHRDPSIIGLLGASPHLSSYFSPISSPIANTPKSASGYPFSLKSRSFLPGIFTAGGKDSRSSPKAASEAFDDSDSPPLSPRSLLSQAAIKARASVATLDRPFYELIVDGIHSHPNSVRLAYNAHPEGCILITDGTCPQHARRLIKWALTTQVAMKILDPNLRDGIHEWREGKRFVKEGIKLYLEGTTTLAGSVVTLDTCVRNFVKFTGCSLGEAIKCATFNPARCLFFCSNPFGRVLKRIVKVLGDRESEGYA